MIVGLFGSGRDRFFTHGREHPPPPPPLNAGNISTGSLATISFSRNSQLHEFGYFGYWPLSWMVCCLAGSYSKVIFSFSFSTLSTTISVIWICICPSCCNKAVAYWPIFITVDSMTWSLQITSRFLLPMAVGNNSRGVTYMCMKIFYIHENISMLQK